MERTLGTLTFSMRYLRKDDYSFLFLYHLLSISIMCVQDSHTLHTAIAYCIFPFLERRNDSHQSCIRLLLSHIVRGSDLWIQSNQIHVQWSRRYIIVLQDYTWLYHGCHAGTFGCSICNLERVDGYEDLYDFGTSGDEEKNLSPSQGTMMELFCEHNRKKETMTTKEKACTRRKMSKVMEEWKRKKLTMRNGKRVTNYKQAVAIGLSEARRYCSWSRRKLKKNMKKSSKRGKARH
jgi:hypothetical protein